MHDAPWHECRVEGHHVLGYVQLMAGQGSETTVDRMNAFFGGWLLRPTHAYVDLGTGLLLLVERRPSEVAALAEMEMACRLKN